MLIEKIERNDQKFFTKVLEICDKHSAVPFGHAALVLIYNDGTGIYYSKAEIKNSRENLLEKLVRLLKALTFGVKGEIIKVNLTKEEVQSIENGDFNTKYEYEINPYKGMNTIVHDIPFKESGFRMYKEAERIHKKKPWFHIIFSNCIKFTKKILKVGGIKEPQSSFPKFAQREQIRRYKSALPTKTMLKLVDENSKIKCGVAPPVYVNRFPVNKETCSSKRNISLLLTQPQVNRNKYIGPSI